MHKYRQRLYQSYVNEWRSSAVPSELTDLRPRKAYLRRLICSHFPANRNAVILDLGCGYGALVHFLRQEGYRNVRGVDHSLGQVEAASQLGIQGVEQGDLLDVLRATAAASVDVVVTFDVMEHFTKEELCDFTDEVVRVLGEGGRWIIHVPNAESPFGSRIRYGDMTHELAFTRESISQWLLASGFRRTHCFEDIPVVHGVRSAIRWVLWKWIRGLLRAYLLVETGAGSKGCIFSQNLLAVAEK